MSQVNWSYVNGQKITNHFEINYDSVVSSSFNLLRAAKEKNIVTITRSDTNNLIDTLLVTDDYINPASTVMLKINSTSANNIKIYFTKPNAIEYLDISAIKCNILLHFKAIDSIKKISINALQTLQLSSLSFSNEPISKWIELSLTADSVLISTASLSHAERVQLMIGTKTAVFQTQSFDLLNPLLKLSIIDCRADTVMMTKPPHATSKCILEDLTLVLSTKTDPSLYSFFVPTKTFRLIYLGKDMFRFRTSWLDPSLKEISFYGPNPRLVGNNKLIISGYFDKFSSLEKLQLATAKLENKLLFTKPSTKLSFLTYMNKTQLQRATLINMPNLKKLNYERGSVRFMLPQHIEVSVFEPPGSKRSKKHGRLPR